MRLFKWLLVILVPAFLLTGCQTGTPESKLTDSGKLTYYNEIGDGYNPTLFYENRISAFGADPGALYIDDPTDKENNGWFFLYPTSDYQVGTYGVAAYKSQDLINWQVASVAFKPEDDSYISQDIWAPEVIFDADADRAYYGLGEGKGVYYMFFSSNDKYHSEEVVYATHSDEEKYLSLSAEIDKLSANQIIAKLNSYRTNNEVSVKVILSDYDNNIKAQGADKNALAKQALKEIETRNITRWPVRNDYGIGLAVSTSPSGPFVQYTREKPANGQRVISKKTPFLTSEDMTEYANAVEAALKLGENGFTMIDIHPYMDPNTGKKYLYFVRRSSRSGEGNFICGIEMGQRWSDDPKWDTLTRLTSCLYTTAYGDELCDTDVTAYLVNEGPFVYYADGTYFLTYSVGNYNDSTYSTCQAIADSPLGPYRKLSAAEGGYILTADARSDVSSPGHHSFVYYKDEIYIVYHAHWDIVTGTGTRGFSADRIYLTKNDDGQTVMQCNGPTVVPMPIMGPTMEYHNIASEAVITASDDPKNKASCLNDGAISIYSQVDFVKEFTAKGEQTITLEFDSPRAVRALMVFNSKDSDTIFHSIDKVEIYYTKNGQDYMAYIDDLPFDEKSLVSDLGMVTRCASSIAEFDELNVKKIVFKFQEENTYALSEIFVLGK